MDNPFDNKKIDAATDTLEFDYSSSSSSSSSSSTLKAISTTNESSTLTNSTTSSASTVKSKTEDKLFTRKSDKYVSQSPNTSSIISVNIIRYPSKKVTDKAPSSSQNNITTQTETRKKIETVDKEVDVDSIQSVHVEEKSLSSVIVSSSGSSTVTVVESKVDEHPIQSKEIVKKTVHVEEKSLSSVIGSSPGSSTVTVVESKGTTLRFVEEDKEPEPILKSSKSKHVRTITSSEDDEEEIEKPALLKSSKSRHAKAIRRDSDDSGDDSTNLQIGNVFVYMVIPPDGGYGWLITFISFLCQVVVDGIIFSIGIILPHIAKDMNRPGSEVVLVASMQVGFYFLSGTVSSAFINKFGFRPVALAGCFMSITVLTISTFSINLPMMIFFYSCLGGPALSMIWVSSQLIIGYYFDKFRPIANGASCSGAGAGIMIFSYMNSVLIPIMGWRNLMRVHVGFLVLVLMMTLTFIEVTPTRIGRVKEAVAEESESESFDLLTGLTQYSAFSLKIDEQEYPLDDEFEKSLERTEDHAEKKSPNWFQKCCPLIHKCWQQRQDEKAQQDAAKHYVIKQELIERQDLFYMGPKDHKQEEQKINEILQRRASQRSSKTDDLAEWRTISLEEFESHDKKRKVINTLSTMHMVREQERERDYQTYKELKGKKKHALLAFLSPKNLIHPKIRKAFRLLFDFRLLEIMEFRILLLSAFLFPMGFNIPFVYSTVRVQIDASFAKLISPTIGFSNFAFRIASGFVAFKFREYTTYICGGGMFFGGVAVFVSAFYGIDVVWFQFVYAMCYGIAPAFYSTLRAIIYVRSLGLDKLTNAFGLTALAMGMGVFIGTTAAGILNDFTGSYSASFIFAGICICASGALKLVLPYLIKLSQDKDGRK